MHGGMDWGIVGVLVVLVVLLLLLLFLLWLLPLCYTWRSFWGVRVSGVWGGGVQASDVSCYGTWRCSVLRGCRSMRHVVVSFGAHRFGVVGSWVVEGWVVMWRAVVCHVPRARDVVSGVVMCRAVECGPRGRGPMVR